MKHTINSAALPHLAHRAILAFGLSMAGPIAFSHVATPGVIKHEELIPTVSVTCILEFTDGSKIEWVGQKVDNFETYTGTLTMKDPNPNQDHTVSLVNIGVQSRTKDPYHVIVTSPNPVKYFVDDIEENGRDWKAEGEKISRADSKNDKKVSYVRFKGQICIFKVDGPEFLQNFRAARMRTSHGVSPPPPYPSNKGQH